MRLPKVSRDLYRAQDGVISAPDPSFIVGSLQVAEMFNKSRWWAQDLLREWWNEQERGGPVRVFKKGKRGYFYTTTAIVDRYMPRGRKDSALERRLRMMERDLGEAFTRIAELERQQGRRR